MISLRLSGEALPVDGLETRLGITPTHVHTKGTPRRPLSAGVHPESVWVAEFTAATEVPFEEQLQGILPFLESRADAMRTVLAIPGVSGELFLGYSSDGGQGGAEFSPDVLGRIAALGLGLTLDLYPPPS